MADIDAYTKLLIHADEADGSTSLADSSDSAHSITANGNAAVKDFNANDNSMINYSGHFNGTDAYLTVPNSSDFNFGTGDFCIEGWVFPTVGSAEQVLYSYGYHASGALTIETDNSAAPKIKIYINASLVLTAITGLELNVWTHLAVVRNSGTLTIYCDGAANGSIADSTNISTTFELRIGHVTSYYNGYLAGFAVHKGAPIYTAAFTPAAILTEMTNDVNTVLFLDFTELTQGLTPTTITDSSTSAHTVTNVSSKVSGCTFWWSGAAEFKGVGDYLSIPDSNDWYFDNNDFTVEFFVSISSLTSTHTIFTQGESLARSIAFSIYSAGWSSFLTLSGSTYSSVYSPNDSIIINKIYHIAAVRDSETLRLYVNGIQVNTKDLGTTSVNDSSSALVFGDGPESGDGFIGFLGEFAIAKGIARYPDGTTFTPPTKQFSHPITAFDIKAPSISINSQVIQEGVYFDAPIPEISSAGINAITCDVTINAPLFQYTLIATQNILACNVVSPKAKINSIGTSQVLGVGNYNVLPEINSTSSNAITCVGRFQARKSVLYVKMGERINIEVPHTVLSSSGDNPIVALVNFRSKRAEISSYGYRWPECSVEVNSSLSKISSFGQVSKVLHVALRVSPKLSAVASQEIQITIDINAPLLRLKGCCDNPITYNVIRYRKDRFCTL